MALFTIILDYAGGTYITQVVSADERSALELWHEGLATKLIAGEVSALVGQAFGASELHAYAPVKGLTNVCCVTASIGDDLALVNVIRTETSR